MAHRHPTTCSPDCPHPQFETIDEIQFVRQRKTDWLSPSELARAGVKAAVAVTFGSYADKRELQAALLNVEAADDLCANRADVLWFDYVADLGDGFDATYSMARLLASDLTLAFDGATHETRRGSFVILGGDQVYPTAARDEYQNRFLGPFRAALPYVGVDPPVVYALPGNHDWYDGLTSFLRIFCQHKLNGRGRWIGAWQTRQKRSYFALRLPNDWWIFAVDSQLESDLDHPQLLYFERIVAAIPEEERAKQKIILVAAEPSWINCPSDDSPKTCRRMTSAFNTLAHFEKVYIRAKGLQLRLVLSGDLHHYARYESDGAMRITSGGGGAYLLGTDTMPPCLRVREGTNETVAAEEPQRAYEKRKTFPDRKESLKLARGVWKLPFRNWKFGLFVGSVYVLLAWLMLTSLATLTFRGFVDAFVRNPLATALAALVVIGAFSYTSAKSEGYRRSAKWLGILHGLGHVVLCCALLAAFTAVFRHSYAIIVPLFLSAWVLGGWLYASFLWIAKTSTGVHADELYSSMAIEDYKNFLRMRLDPNGTLTVYAIGLRRVAHDWKFQAPGPDDHGVPWFHSAQFGADAEHSPHVIERFEVK